MCSLRLLVCLIQGLTRLKATSSLKTSMTSKMWLWLTLLIMPFVPTTSCFSILTMWWAKSKKFWSSTNLRVVLWKGVVILMDCTKPLKQKKVCQSRMKPRHLPQSLTKTFSVCTRNCLVWRVQVRLRKKNSVKFTTFVLFQSQQTVLFNVLTIQTYFLQALKLSLKQLSKTLRLVTKKVSLSWLVQ